MTQTVCWVNNRLIAIMVEGVLVFLPALLTDDLVAVIAALGCYAELGIGIGDKGKITLCRCLDNDLAG
jgi:hypothetical protein